MSTFPGEDPIGWPTDAQILERGAVGRFCERCYQRMWIPARVVLARKHAKLWDGTYFCAACSAKDGATSDVAFLHTDVWTDRDLENHRAHDAEEEDLARFGKERNVTRVRL